MPPHGFGGSAVWRYENLRTSFHVCLLRSDVL